MRNRKYYITFEVVMSEEEAQVWEAEGDEDEMLKIFVYRELEVGKAKVDAWMQVE